jgi:hypothetical protein
VYVCPALPCAGGQELEVFDHNGAPIFSVGETGGAAVFGDNASVYAPGSVTHPAVVLSWESPAAYDAKFRLPTGCVAPAIWESPADIWACQGGKWVVKVAL